MYALLATAAYVLLSLFNDSLIRDEVYTNPLSRMPENARALIKEILTAAVEGGNLTSGQILTIEKHIYRMMSEGAVEQRNFEMEKTRAAISYSGLFLSWFMKNKGLTYVQIQAKYEREFPDDERKMHLKIIESAARSNPNLFAKLFDTLKKKTGLVTPKPGFIQSKL